MKEFKPRDKLTQRMTTPDSPTSATRFGNAMRPLSVSAMSHARDRFIVAPTMQIKTKTI